jgi:hypothetical protein
MFNAHQNPSLQCVLQAWFRSEPTFSRANLNRAGSVIAMRSHQCWSSVILFICCCWLPQLQGFSLLPFTQDSKLRAHHAAAAKDGEADTIAAKLAADAPELSSRKARAKAKRSQAQASANH